MKQSLTDLWNLQQIDSQIHEIERNLIRLNTGTEASRLRDEAKSSYESAVVRLHAIDAELKDIELNIKSTETKRKDFESRMYSGKVVAAKELEAMGQEVEMLRKHRDKLETRELELMDEQTGAQQSVAETKAEFESTQKDFDELSSASVKAKTKLEKGLAAIKKTREPQAAVVTESDPALMRKYEGLRSKLANVVIVAVSGASCSFCNVQISGYELRDIKKGEETISCESCGRILVWNG